jgi:hypothetical protein
MPLLWLLACLWLQAVLLALASLLLLLFFPLSVQPGALPDSCLLGTLCSLARVLASSHAAPRS